MAFYTELPVYKDSYQLVLKVFEVTRDFSREYKYTLGQDMKRDALHLLRCIYRANKHQNRQACRQFLRNLPGLPSPRKGQKLATSMPPATLAVLVPLDFDPHTGLKIYAPQ
jgi:hypothetical protein